MKNAPYFILVVLLYMADVAYAGWTVVELSSPGASSSEATAVCAFGDGVWVSGSFTSGPRTHAGVWNSATASWTDLNVSDGLSSTATDVYADARGVWVTGHAGVGTGTDPHYWSEHAGLWDARSGTWIDLDNGALYSYGFGVYERQVMGFAYYGNEYSQAALWDADTRSCTLLTPQYAVGSLGAAVHDGHQVGIVQYPHDHAALWSGTAATCVDLNPAGASTSSATGVYQDEQVGYAVVSGHSSAGLWHGTAESWVNLNPVGASESYAAAVRNGYQVGKAYFGGLHHAGIWEGSAASWIDLNPLGVIESTATGVYAGDGEIWVSGYVTTASGSQAVLWHYSVPEPSSLCVILVSVCAMLALRARSKASSK